MTKETLLHAFDYKKELGILIWKNPSKHHIQRIGQEAGTVTVGVSSGYRMTHVMRKHMLVHKIIYFLEKGEWSKIIDHIDGNKLNNRIENLRPVTNRENCLNKKIHREGKLAGTYYCKSRKKWRSEIQINGKKKFLGSFDSEILGHTAYMVERNKLLSENNIK